MPDELEQEKEKPLLLIDLSELGDGKQFEIDLPGLGGLHQQLTFDVNYDSVKGKPSDYKVVFTLCRPGFSLLPDDHYAEAVKLEGDSHLAIAEPAHKNPQIPEGGHMKLESNIDDYDFKFRCYPNSKGFLGKLELETINANSFGDAGVKAIRGLTFALSGLSFRYDVPLYVYQIDIAELKTGSRRMTIVRAFNETDYAFDAGRVSSEEFNRYASFYREGLNTNSFSYQFLCFYKIIEGLRQRRERLNQEAIAAGKDAPFPAPKEKIPEERDEQIEWLKAVFPNGHKWDGMSLSSIFIPESLGKKVKHMVSIHSPLHKIRLNIAHGILEDGEATLSFDDVIDLELVNKWLPLTRCLARYLLNEMFPERLLDTVPTEGKVRLYRSRRFTRNEEGEQVIYEPEPESLEFVKEMPTQILNGKVSWPSDTLDMKENGIGMDSNGDPTVIFVGMEVHEDDSEHVLFVGHIDVPAGKFLIRQPHLAARRKKGKG